MATKPRQRSLKLTCPKPEPVREETVQANIRQLLAWCGYRVYQTTARFKAHPCPQCGGWVRQAGGTGTTPGVPDLLVYHPGWTADGAAHPVWIGLEVKGPKTPLSDEQKVLHAAGRILVARSPEEALRLLQAAEERLFGRIHGNRPKGWD